jgi:preprotein translocase SecE subunit
MATAVKNSSKPIPISDSHSRLIQASVIGIVFVAASLAFIIFGIPYLWKVGMTPFLLSLFGKNASFFDAAGLIVVLITAFAAFLIGGLAIAGPSAPDGLRGSVFLMLVSLIGIFLIDVAVGKMLERYLFKTENLKMIGIGVTVAVGIALLFFAIRYVLTPAYSKFAVAFDHQGWFRNKTYKSNQGVRVRRFTILGILILVGTGIWTLNTHNSLAGDWRIHLPFSLMANGSVLYVMLLPDLEYTVPLILTAAGLWIAFRAVNFPAFADFLIATEAEMNKVSWSTRKKLVQDTIVVLVTVFLFAVFLLVVDTTWGWLLTRETLFGGIVPKPKVTQTQADNTQELPW